MIKPSFFNQVAFVNDLWNEMTTTGFSNRSKNDFYDFVLYLLNKYDRNHFLSENDNAYNERLLKTKATRIKSAKKNISVQFMTSEEYDAIFVEFIKKISSDNILSLNDTGDAYTMVVEDTALRSVLETKLKRITNTTLDYKMNKEIVTISYEAFLKMLAVELNFSDDSDGIIELLSGTIASLKNEKNTQVVQQALTEAIGALKDSDSLQSFAINGLKAVAAFAVTKLLAVVPAPAPHSFGK